MKLFQSNLKAVLLLKSLKSKVEKAISDEISCMGDKNTLRDACEFALLNGGKRLRPIIVLMIAQSLNKGFDAMHASLAIEFFHTASLIADDLPCMDDENERRCKAALHKKYDEATAILASYSLISSGYEMILKNSKIMRQQKDLAYCDRVCVLAIETISQYAGILGATQGQFLDLFSKEITLENLEKIIHLKTISLFEIAFLLGWVFGGGDLDKLEKIKKCAYHFGKAFQIADDLQDYQEDLEKGKKINFAIAFGKNKAIEIFDQELKHLKKTFKELGIYSESFQILIDLLDKNTKKTLYC